MTDHPITPPPDLLKHWEEQHFDQGENYDVMLIQAYQAGADAELEACVKWVSEYCPYFADYPMAEDKLRAARRPKPSLKEQALAALKRQAVRSVPSLIATEDCDTIRRALEALPE